MTELSIVPECHVDTKVAEIVGGNGKYNHKHGCGDVAIELEFKLKDSVAIGIIDEDKNKGTTAKYLFEFDIIKSENNLILKRHKKRKQYLILICPEIEEWLLNDAVVTNLNPQNFGLPKDIKGLKSKTKTQDIDKNIDFYRFIKALIRENAPSITTLKTWLELYKTDQLDTLIN